MIVIIDSEEISCVSCERTATNLKLKGTINGDVEYIGINWDKVILPENILTPPSLDERISAMESLLLEIA